MPIRKRTLKPDEKGRYRPYMGYRIDGKQQRFNLGTDKAEAERRLNRLFELWEDNVRDTGEEVWSPRALSFAKQVASGKRQVELRLTTEFLKHENPAAAYAQDVNMDRGRFPSLEVVAADPEIYAIGLRVNEHLVGAEVEHLQNQLKLLGALSQKQSLPSKLVSGRFFEALDAYAEDVRSHNVWAGTDKLKQTGHRRLEMIDRFKERHDDIPLSLLGSDACKSLIRYWCKRPPKKDRKTSEFNGEPVRVSTARHHRKELDRFFRWLDSTERFSWELPRGFRQIDRSIGLTQDEFAQRLSAIQKDTYTIAELAILNRHATPLERLVLYVGLNCGMGAAELGRIREGDILLRHAHQLQERLHFTSTDQDSFIRYLRPKTSVFGEWLIWPETVRMLEWGITRSKQIGHDILFVSDRGQPWYNETVNKNPQAKFTNVLNALIRRVRKSQPEFRQLSFGTLRDTLPNILRIHHSSEMASICLAHGSTFRGDKLIECYTNKPFGRFHELMRSARGYFAAVFEAAPKDPTSPQIQEYIPLNTREKMRALICADAPVSDIVSECKVSAMTVYREKERIANEG